MRANAIDRSAWPPLPAPHAAFLEPALLRLRDDARIVGVAAAGSFARATVDEHSDIDLVVAVEPLRFDDVLRDRSALAHSLGPLLVAFTGEHVGEPRLLICLYGPPPLHVDLKFVALPDAARRVDECVVLWERDARLSAALAAQRAAYPAPDLQWIEDRIWPWVHYLAAKIARGELFETLDGLGYIRARVLGPLALQLEGAQPNGVRRVESAAPGYVDGLRATVAEHDAASCTRALHATVALYRELRERSASKGLTRRSAAEAASLLYLDQVEARRAGRSR
jgi:predicted nucleotidyltransferase